ncbi:MAG: P1 family peptidase, partial [Alphaproteobacteria bacterium]|nr:P1 family peptidase [Alphaproteobacteria bacterium]
MKRARLRELGIATGLLPPGPLNTITDVAGVRVGHATVSHDTPSVARTGVTAIWPAGPDIWSNAVFAGYHSFNGNGEMTGTIWIAEQGLIAGPVCITNTHSVGVVRDAIVAYAIRERAQQPWHLPVTAETYDGWLSDADSFPVKAEHAFAALDSAATGPVAEGCVGGGTGMICHEFKGGIGTA